MSDRTVWLHCRPLFSFLNNVMLVTSTKLISMIRRSYLVACAGPLSMALVLIPSHLPAQSATDEAPQPPMVDSLQLAPDVANQLQRTIGEHNYVAAETLLLPEIERDPRSPRAAHLLAYAGSVYFRNQDYVNAVIAWKRSEAIVPLAPSLRFSLAMA